MHTLPPSSFNISVIGGYSFPTDFLFSRPSCNIRMNRNHVGYHCLYHLDASLQIRITFLKYYPAYYVLSFYPSFEMARNVAANAPVEKITLQLPTSSAMTVRHRRIIPACHRDMLASGSFARTPSTLEPFVSARHVSIWNVSYH